MPTRKPSEKEFVTVLRVAPGAYRLAVRSAASKKIIRWVNFEDVRHIPIYPDRLVRRGARLGYPAHFTCRWAAVQAAAQLARHWANGEALW